VKKLRRCEQALNVVASKGPTLWRMGYLVASRIDYVKEFATSSSDFAKPAVAEG
jgi:hypothetical protein